MVAEGKFREDLYYRLNVLPIVLPPLRERREDMPVLMEHFLERYSRATAAIDVPAISPAVRHAFTRYRWPGNVRELENACERIMQTCTCGTVRVGCLAASVLFGRGAQPSRHRPPLADVDGRAAPISLDDRLREVESNLIRLGAEGERRQQVEGRRTAPHQALDARRSHHPMRARARSRGSGPGWAMAGPAT